MTKTLKSLIALNSQNSGFAIACVAHELLGNRWNNPEFMVPEGSGNLVFKVTANWVRNKSTEVHID